MQEINTCNVTVTGGFVDSNMCEENCMQYIVLSYGNTHLLTVSCIPKFNESLERVEEREESETVEEERKGGEEEEGLKQ